jgi:hypothetical protein
MAAGLIGVNVLGTSPTIEDVKAMKFEKLPVHMVLIFESPSSRTQSEILSVISLCIHLGIHYLTLYDPRGFLPFYALVGVLTPKLILLGYFRSLALDSPKTFLPAKLVKGSVAGKPLVNNQVNSKASLSVNILSEAEGKSHFVQVLKTMGKQAKQGTLKAEDIDINLIDSKINGTGT